MIAQGAMAFNSRRSLTACPYSVPQILVTLIRFQLTYTIILRKTIH